MRTIRISDLPNHMPKGWEEKANTALAEIQDLPPAERAEAIRQRARIWSKVKKALGELSGGKCWYCESLDPRSHKDVDHFRPKNRVAECSTHPGYWWLAFDWHNYRLSCNLCNRQLREGNDLRALGKGDRFPIREEARRALSPSDSIDAEECYLLDPVKPTDTAMLWFDQNGDAVPAYSKDESEYAYERAMLSIEVYNLNHINVREARLAVISRVVRLVRDGSVFEKSNLDGDKMAIHGFYRTIEELSLMMRPNAVFSKAVKATLMGFRDHKWVRNFLSNE